MIQSFRSAQVGDLMIETVLPFSIADAPLSEALHEVVTHAGMGLSRRGIVAVTEDKCVIVPIQDLVIALRERGDMSLHELLETAPTSKLPRSPFNLGGKETIFRPVPGYPNLVSVIDPALLAPL